MKIISAPKNSRAINNIRLGDGLLTPKTDYKRGVLPLSHLKSFEVASLFERRELSRAGEPKEWGARRFFTALISRHKRKFQKETERPNVLFPFVWRSSCVLRRS